ncbi:ADP-ribose glycohydrolase MACROD2 isoform X2 [Colossoma macropomum]|uniref:ADP-ribose glycohydrolase MACROD2 isoform X2 n=1 Tax=Colossoma macropomum TaxID=42526 RepID=UPI0018641758|nr:ADP-ribose glycohydrolase MACROD2 isoform X2 [Colossoma macropomum]
MSKKKKEWRAEKERLLSLGLEERRKEYGNYVTLEKITPWRRHGKAPEEEEDHSASLCNKVSLYKGDITILEVDAIVNAANSSLLGGGGVDGCIHRAAGHFLYEECHSLNGCDTGKAKITCGYDLPAKYVIHTVGPIARGNVGPSQSDDLKSCYENSLKLVKDNELRSVAFPCISTGIYGFPNEPAADIALNTVRDWLKKNKDEIDRVIFCVFLETDYEIYKRKMSDFFPPDNKECEEGDGAPSENDSKQEAAGDVEMLSQAQEDDNMDDVGTQSQKSENNTAADENPKDGKEMDTDASNPVEDVNPAGEHKTEEEEKLEQKKEKSGDAAEREPGGEEKIQSAPADAQAEQEKDQVKSVDTKEEGSQGGADAMEGIEDGDKNPPAVANDDEVSNAKVELKHQDEIPPEPNQAAQTDSSQSKDGSADKNDPKKE